MNIKRIFSDGQYQTVIDNITDEKYTERSFDHHYYYIKALNRLSKINKAIQYTKTVLSGNLMKNDLENLKLLYELIWGYQKESNWSSAQSYFDDALQIIDKIDIQTLNKDDKQVAYSIINIGGIIHYALGNLDKAMDFINQLLDNQEEIQKDQVIQGGKINLALIYMDRGKYEESIMYLTKALELATKNNHNSHMRVGLNNLTYLYTTIGDLNKAEYYANQTLEICKQMDDTWGMAVILMNMGRIYQKRGNYHKALENLDRSYKLMQNFDNQEYIARALFYKLLIHLDQQNRFEANEILQEVNTKKETSDNPRISLIYQVMEAIYLRYSNLYRHKLEAEDKFTEIIDAKYEIEEELLSYCYLYLTELYLEQLSEIQTQLDSDQNRIRDDEKSIIDEVEDLSDEILQIANQLQAPEMKLQVHYIKAHIAMIKLDSESLTYHLDQAESFANKWNIVNVTISKPNLENTSQLDADSSVHIDLASSINDIIHSLPRLKIMIALSMNSNLTFTELQKKSGLTSGNLSNHCRVLIENGYINKTKAIVDDRFHTLYSMTPSGLNAFKKYTSKIKLFLSS